MSAASGVFVRVEMVEPRLAQGDRAAVETFLADLTTRRCLHGWSLARNYSGPLDVTLSLLVSQASVYEILSRMMPPPDPKRASGPDDFKGIRFTYPTGITAKTVLSLPRGGADAVIR